MDEIEKLATEKPASFIELPTPEHKAIDFNSIAKNIDKLYELCDPESARCYKKGKILRITHDTPATTVLNHVIGLYIDKVRNGLDDIDSEEQKKNLQVEVNKIHKALDSIIDLLKTENFKLDIYSVLHIIHGYTSSNMKPVFEHYETRRRTTHRHHGT